MRKGDDTGEDKNIGNNFKGNSPLALENAQSTFMKNKNIFEALDKKLIFESDKNKESLLDESQIKE